MDHCHCEGSAGLCSAVGKTLGFLTHLWLVSRQAKDLEGRQGFKAAHSGKGDSGLWMARGAKMNNSM